MKFSFDLTCFERAEREDLSSRESQSGMKVVSEVEEDHAVLSLWKRRKVGGKVFCFGAESLASKEEGTVDFEISRSGVPDSMQKNYEGLKNPSFWMKPSEVDEKKFHVDEVEMVGKDGFFCPVAFGKEKR